MFGIFDTMLTYSSSYFIETYAAFYVTFGIVFQYKIGLQEGKTEFMQK